MEVEWYRPRPETLPSTRHWPEPQCHNSVMKAQGQMASSMGRIFRDHRSLVLFFCTYYFVFVAYGIVTGASQVIFYALFIAIAAGIVAWLYSIALLSRLVLWGLALWGLMHMFGGLVEINGRVVYEWSLGDTQARFDKVVHFFGFGFATLAAYELLRKTIAASARPRSVAFAAFFIGLGVGALNETIEFLITLLPGESHVGGFSNTGWDLVANALGAGVAAWSGPHLERVKK